MRGRPFHSLGFDDNYTNLKTWSLQQARQQFSRLVQLAESAGPQMVTRRGQPVAVIVSAHDFRKMRRPRETVLEFFAPLRGSGIRLRRRRDYPQRAKR